MVFVGMDQSCNLWYYSCMRNVNNIPDYALFGETDAFPDVLHCEHFEDRAPSHGWQISPHRHAQLAQIFYVKEGEGKAFVDSQIFDLFDNVVLYIPPQTVHEFHLAPFIQGMVQSFPYSLLRNISPNSAELLDSLSRPIVANANEALVTLLTQLDAALRENGPFRSQISIGLGHAALARIAALGVAKQNGGATLPDQRLARLDQLIAKHMGLPRTAREYATDMGLSTGHLTRLCRATRGLSAAAYIESATMQEACRLLAFTSNSMAEVGYRLGFSDPSYFSRRFRSVQGVTPSQYRKQFIS